MCILRHLSHVGLCHLGCSPPGSSMHGILQARLLEWVSMPSSRGSSQPRDRTCVSYISFAGRQVLYCLHHLGNPVSSLRLEATVFLLYHVPTCRGTYSSDHRVFMASHLPLLLKPVSHLSPLLALLRQLRRFPAAFCIIC